MWLTWAIIHGLHYCTEYTHRHHTLGNTHSHTHRDNRILMAIPKQGTTTTTIIGRQLHVRSSTQAHTRRMMVANSPKANCHPKGRQQKHAGCYLTAPAAAVTRKKRCFIKTAAAYKRVGSPEKCLSQLNDMCMCIHTCIHVYKHLNNCIHRYTH